MTWNLFGQYTDVALTCILIARLWKLDLFSKYLAFLVFVVFDAFQSLAYIGDHFLWRHGLPLDYRLVWCFLVFFSWVTLIWMVYELMTGILKQLPGILRFSLRFLNVTFVVAILIALFTVFPQYSASNLAVNPDWKVRLTELGIVLDRAFSFAQLLTIFSVLTFLLFFPVRVPRNLAVLSVALSIYLCIRVGWRLSSVYLPKLVAQVPFDPLPFVYGFFVLYWIYSLSTLGEKARATLGRAWQSIPQERIVRQLDAINAALLR